MSFVKKPIFTTAILGLLAVGLLLAFLRNHSQRPTDPRLASPTLLLQELGKSGLPVFITPEFLPFISSLPAAEKEFFPSLSDSEKASLANSSFWRLNREKHYSALLIGVTPASRPLANSLLDSSLWLLSDVSPWGYLLRPNVEGTLAWQLPSQQELEKTWPGVSDRALFLILTAANLEAIDHLSDAESLLTLAAATHQHPSLLLSTQASIAASRGHWNEAVTLANKALGKDRSNRPAREILIRALIESGQTDEALEQAHELIKRNGEDETTLFLLARTANAAHSRQEEIKALERLVEVGQKDRQPLGASLTYLGQSYAKNGQRSNALRTLQQALLAPELTEDERKEIRDVMDHLMQGNVSSSTLPPLPIATPPEAAAPTGTSP